jgi:hypothetical protein
VKFKLDENLPADLETRLRQEGMGACYQRARLAPRRWGHHGDVAVSFGVQRRWR